MQMESFINRMRDEFPGRPTLTRPEIQTVSDKYGMRKEFTAYMTAPTNKLGRGVYIISDSVHDAAVNAAAATPKPDVPKKKRVVIIPSTVNVSSETVHVNDMKLVPTKDPLFVPFGDYNLLNKIISSRKFFPVYISGESGNGKTKMVDQSCAASTRELIRVNITESTDEDDLIGGFRLLNGETVWQDGPVIESMKRGAVLLLDEINLASSKIMCLQPVLEGNPIYIKKTNTLVTPASGFTIVATANTKGQSSEDGRYIGSNTLNEALLDRFCITIEHAYPSKAVESKILRQVAESMIGVVTPEINDFILKLSEWSDIIRSTFDVGGIDDIITTRRLIHIITFNIITNSQRIEAIKYAVARFSDESKRSFVSLYQKVDESVIVNSSGIHIMGNDPHEPYAPTHGF